ncbi:MAG: hypothetical protein EPN93_13185 [Spirochaetes bacterium]|nr:MAG: hypothetical protein EPN93_13185 [Spirochaetota bacterium]
MKSTTIVCCACLLLFSFCLPVYSQEKGIAVVRSQFDPMEKTLALYKIPCTLIRYADLEDPLVFESYRAIFFPSGIESPLEANVNILSRGTSIQGVFLKEDYYEVDTHKAYQNIRDFIKSGGLGYFSGFSYHLLDGAFGEFTFFDDFPFMGLSGPLELYLYGELRSYYSMDRLSRSVPHSGWVALQSIGDSETLADGQFDTPRGTQTGPILARLERGKGEAYYASYYDDESTNGIKRFFTYRIAFNEMLKAVQSRVHMWDQKYLAGIVDSVLPGESCRSYSIQLSKGRHTLYFLSRQDYFQVDLLDKNNAIVASTQPWLKEFEWPIKVSRDASYTIKIYPYPGGRFVPYAFAVGSGSRLLPYWRTIILVLFFVSIIAGLSWLYKLVNPRKYSGRFI